MSWNNFNDAEEQYDVIPAGTIAKVILNIKKGGYNEPDLGWTGDYATRNPETGACYLSCEYTILEGKFAKRKVWSMIGLYSPKGEKYANMGRALIKAILNSSRGIKPKDNSPDAQAARQISGFGDLDGIEFIARIDVEDGDRGQSNRIQKAITADHKDYAAIMNPQGSNNNSSGGTPAPAAPPAPQAAASANRPSWAQ